MVDGHTHVASSDTARYPLAPTGVGSDWWQDGADVASLLAAMDAAGVDRAVVVQAVGAYGYDCSYAVDAVASAPHRLALVGAVDLEADDPPLVGAAVRVFAVGGGLTSPVPAWLGDGRADDVWRRCAEEGRGVVATVLEHHLPALERVLDAWPHVAVALDHCAFSPPEVLEPLARHGNLHLKVSTHVLQHSDEPAALVRRLADAFGADRLCWGSDFPQSAGTYGEMVELGRAAAGELDEVEAAAFLGGNADRLWFAT